MCKPFCITDKRGRRQSVPCGKCLECLQEKKQEWCFRLDIEKRYSNSSFFVTFTYDDDHLIFADDEPCLCKRDIQLFFKRLRKSLKGDKIKYYCVGEYGEHWRPLTPRGRPHYHALIFYRGNRDWFDIHLLIKKLWFSGIVQVGHVTGAQGYVTKYILKFDKRPHLVKPFSLISHGLGIDYLSDTIVLFHRQNLVSYALKPGGYHVNLPRYYKDRIFSDTEKKIIKKRSDLYRRDLELKRLVNIDIQMDLGVNPFKNQIVNYQNRLYKALSLYREKKKL